MRSRRIEYQLSAGSAPKPKTLVVNVACILGSALAFALPLALRDAAEGQKVEPARAPHAEWSEALGHATSCVAGVLEKFSLDMSSRDDAVRAAGICGAPLYEVGAKLGMTQIQARAILDDIIRAELAASSRE